MVDSIDLDVMVDSIDLDAMVDSIDLIESAVHSVMANSDGHEYDLTELVFRSKQEKGRLVRITEWARRDIKKEEKE